MYANVKTLTLKETVRKNAFVSAKPPRVHIIEQLLPTSKNPLSAPDIEEIIHLSLELLSEFSGFHLRHYCQKIRLYLQVQARVF